MNNSIKRKKLLRIIKLTNVKLLAQQFIGWKLSTAILFMGEWLHG
jgi:hypothetical protein